MAKKYNCEKNGIKYFRKTKTIGHDLNGEPIKKEFYGDGEKDCERQIEEYMNLNKSGLPVGFEKITVEQLMKSWLFDVLLTSKDLKSASFEKHETNYRLYVKNSPIGFLKVHEITTKPIQLYYNKLYEEKELSTNKIIDINKTLRKFFFYCTDNNYITKNPCLLRFIEIPGNADGDEDSEQEGENIDAYSEDEIKSILSALDKEKDKTLAFSIGLTLFTGMRLGEMLGLKNKFLNTDSSSIKIKNTLQRIRVYEKDGTYKIALKIKSPKTKSSIRNIPFASALIPNIKKYIELQKEKWYKNGLDFTDDSLLITTATCNCIEPRNFERAYERFLKRHNLPQKKFHSLRDTYATTLFRNGATILEVKELLGHTSSKTTEKYYLTVFPEDKKDAAELLSKLIQIPSREIVGK